MDEIFETATLIQTGKIDRFPLVLMGTDYWGDLLDFMNERMVACGTISASDVDRFMITDSPEEAVDHIHQVGVERFGLVWQHQPKPRWLFGEKSLGATEAWERALQARARD